MCSRIRRLKTTYLIPPMPHKFKGIIIKKGADPKVSSSVIIERTSARYLDCFAFLRASFSRISIRFFRSLFSSLSIAFNVSEVENVAPVS
jgi:hypothetical protein